jgi:hypothetical protein
LMCVCIQPRDNLAFSSPIGELCTRTSAPKLFGRRFNGSDSTRPFKRFHRPSRGGQDQLIRESLGHRSVGRIQRCL